MHVQLYSGARHLALVPIFSTWRSEGSGETAQMSSLICAFTALQCDKVQSLFNINYAMLNLVP